MQTKTERLLQIMTDAGIRLTEAQAGQLVRYSELLTDWNTRMNLTAITDFDEIVVKHFADSLLPLADVSRETSAEASPAFPAGARVIDVGTGAGFPGIPLAVARPDLSVTLLDSLQKRVGFLGEVIRELGLSGCTALHARAEDAARDAAHREAYDLCVSRAVADLPVLAEYCLPFVKRGGLFVAYKARNAAEELSRAETALKKLGGRAEQTLEVPLPGSDAQRTLIYIRKTASTPKAYPRRAGTPAKAPL